MSEYEKIFEREGEKFLRQDYQVDKEGELPDFPADPSGYKIIIKDENEKYYSTNIYESLDEAFDDSDTVMDNYGVDPEAATLIISVYFPV